MGWQSVFAVVFQAGNTTVIDANGIRVYQGAPAFNNLILSAGLGNFTDAFGNFILSDYVVYDQISNNATQYGDINITTWSAPSQAGPYTQLLEVFLSGVPGLAVQDGNDGVLYETQRASYLVTLAQTIAATSFATILALTQAVSPRFYRVHGQVYITANQSAGQMAMRWTASAGTTGLVAFVWTSGATVNDCAGPKGVNVTANPGFVMVAGQVYTVTIDGIVNIGSTGNFALQAACSVAADTFSVGVDSFLDMMPL